MRPGGTCWSWLIALSTAACSGEPFEPSAGAGTGGATGGVGGATGGVGGATGGVGGATGGVGGATGGVGGTTGGVGGATGGSGGATGGASGASGGSAGAGATGATGGSGGLAGVCPTSLPGPKMVKVSAGSGKDYCIDATEVSAAHYQSFLQSSSKPAQPAYCAWNSTFTPLAGWPPPTTAWPVVSIDWCDAWSYCAWAGKRLCGKIGGGPSGDLDEKALTDEWYFACSGGGAKTYPYGNTYSGSACNTQDAGKGQPTPVGSLKACEGGFSGIFDLGGNVVEWVDACDGYSGASDKCHDRNGSYQTNLASQSCGATYRDPRNSTWPDVGIRCCFGPI